MRVGMGYEVLREGKCAVDDGRRSIIGSEQTPEVWGF